MKDSPEQLALFRPIYIQRTDERNKEVLVPVAQAPAPDKVEWTGTRESRLKIAGLPLDYFAALTFLPAGVVIYKVWNHD
jgi:hypothetical protein